MAKESASNFFKEKKSLAAMLAFCLTAFVIIMAGVYALDVPAVPMCVLVMLEAGIAVMLHHAEIWIHGLLVLAEIVAGIFTDRIVLVILCAVMYVAATAALQVLGEDE